MDVFIEKIVSKKPDKNDVLKMLGIIFGSIIILGIVFVFLTWVFPLILIAVLILDWYFITSLSVEYEYILTNGDLDVDKIIAQRERKRLVTVQSSGFEILANYKKNINDYQRYKNNVQKIINATDNKTDEDIYFGVFIHKDFGKTMLLFQPNDKMIDMFSVYCREKFKR